MFRGKVDGVIQSRFASRIDVIERVDQIANTAGEILFEVRRVVEVHDEGFVIGIALTHKRKRRAVHALALIAHAAAVVDDQAEAQRNIFVLERLDRLQNFVFENLKILFRQPVNRTAFPVEHGNGQLYFERFDTQRVAFIALVFLRLTPFLSEYDKRK